MNTSYATASHRSPTLVFSKGVRPVTHWVRLK